MIPTTWCCELELSGDTPVTAVLPAGPSTGLRALVRLHGEPLGYIGLDTVDDPVDRIVAAAWQAHPDRIRHHLRAEGLSTPDGTRPPVPEAGCGNRVEPAGPVTVVVCTRNRADILRGCLRALSAVRYPDVEFLIVDNAPVDSSTRMVVDSLTAADSRFRYVCEPAPGLSRARNRGLREARGTYVAYTDDDVSVDPLWVHGLVGGFARDPHVSCVTGLVCTASITNEAEAYFDARAASWSSRCRPQMFDLADHRLPDALYPYSAGIFGTGANFAFRRDALDREGGFDEALGAGTATRGGEDLDMFVRLLRAGDAIAYQPSAVVWHHHRADNDALRNQMYGYGVGLAAFLTKHVLHRATRGDVLRRVPVGLRRMSRIRRTTRQRLDERASAPKGALLREFAGFAAGPALYLRAHRGR